MTSVKRNWRSASAARASGSASQRTSKALDSVPTRAAASRSAPTARSTSSPARHRRARTETALGQICADYLGVDFKSVDVVTGDSAAIPYGVGTFAEPSNGDRGNADRAGFRTIAPEGAAVSERIKLECRSEDLDLVNGEIFVKGTPEKKITLRMLGPRSGKPRLRLYGRSQHRDRPGGDGLLFAAPLDAFQWSPYRGRQSR